MFKTSGTDIPSVPAEFRLQRLKRLKSLLTRNPASIRIFFIIFYAVGLTGLLLPFTFSFFVTLIPLALLLSAAALALFHENISGKQAFLFTIIFLAGFFIEVAGVNTAVIFGPYRYGKSLGPALFNTPLIIGLNWLLLVYVTATVTENMRIPAAGKVFTGAILMLGYDFIIEQVAPVLDMWHWHDISVPLQNYLAWFVIATVFHSLIGIFGINLANKLGPFMFFCLAVFFLLLAIFIN